MRRFLTLLVTIVVFGASSALAQTKTVSGKVTSSDGNQPLPGVNVFVKSSPTVGTMTDVEGNFTLKNIPANAKVIAIRFVGYQTVELPVSSSFDNIVLQSENQKIDEIVVVAYGTAKKESVTGAVAQVNSKAIERRPVSSIGGALEGQAVGVQVNNSYGQPGADAEIRIRGFSSVNGSNAPLYVVDGVPYSGTISSLNPADIESMSVLKDASSTALFGSRASNGVILITTKKGSGDKMTTRVTVNQGIYERGMKEYKRIGANDYMETMWQGYRNGLVTAGKSVSEANSLASSTLISDVLRYNIYGVSDDKLFDGNGKLNKGVSVLPQISEDLDWYDPMERLGHRQEYNISTSTATEKSNAFFSVGYLDEKGYLKSSGFSRITARSNVSFTPKKWLKVGLNISGTHQNADLTTGDADNANGIANPFNFAKNMASIYPVHLHDLSTGDYVVKDGEKVYDEGSKYGRPELNGRHIVWETNLNSDERTTNSLTAQAFAEISFLKDFKFIIKGNLDNRQSYRKGYSNAIIGDGAGLGRLSGDNRRYKEYTGMEQLTYNKTIANVHNIDLLVGHENYSYNFNYDFGFKQGESFVNIPFFNNFATINSLNGYEDNYCTESYLGRAKYNYDNKYFVEGSFRRDGSSRFAKDSRWGNFWSIGGSWSISKEEFMKSLEWVNSLKLRASYGQVGNDNVNSYYAYMPLMYQETNGGASAIFKKQNAAADLQWESSNSISTALEGRLFDKANFTVEYFDKRSTDLLFDTQLPLSAGSTTDDKLEAKSVITQNLGSVANKGVEISVDYDVFKNKDWRWNIGASATMLKNEIVKLPEQNRENGIINGSKKYVEGRSMYDFWLYQWAGVDQMDGSALFVFDDAKYSATDATVASKLKTINGKTYSTTTNYAKQDWSGSVIPDVYGSLNTSLSYKNFDFSMLCTYSVGGKTLDYSYASLMSVGSSPNAIHEDILNAWESAPAGMTADSPNRINADGIPAVNFSKNTDYNQTLSTRFTKDASYFVIKNISMNYRLPDNLAKKADLTSVALTISIENLATFTKRQGMNPQQQFNGISNNVMLPSRVLTLGLNIVL